MIYCFSSKILTHSLISQTTPLTGINHPSSLYSNSWDGAAHAPPIPFRTSAMTYLGINISARLSEPLTLNFTPLLKTMTDNLLCLIQLPLSFMGRIAIVKMAVLPRINYSRDI